MHAGRRSRLRSRRDRAARGFGQPALQLLKLLRRDAHAASVADAGNAAKREVAWTQVGHRRTGAVEFRRAVTSCQRPAPRVQRAGHPAAGGRQHPRADFHRLGTARGGRRLDGRNDGVVAGASDWGAKAESHLAATWRDCCHLESRPGHSARRVHRADGCGRRGAPRAADGASRVARFARGHGCHRFACRIRRGPRGEPGLRASRGLAELGGHAGANRAEPLRRGALRASERDVPSRAGRAARWLSRRRFPRGLRAMATLAGGWRPHGESPAHAAALARPAHATLAHGPALCG